MMKECEDFRNLLNFRLYKLLIGVIFLILSPNVNAQYTITGDFPQLAGHHVRLVGFEGFDIYSIDSTKTTEQGQFSLKYTFGDRGMGFLATEDNRPYFVVLAGENIHLKGSSLSSPIKVVCLSGIENQLFTRYAIEQPKRLQVLSAWDYLLKIYKTDSLFNIHAEEYKAISKEIQRINKEDKDFLENLDPDSYVSWYLPVRKLVSSVSNVAQYKTEEIPSTIAAFRKLDYTDYRLYKSGLYKDVIDSQYWLLENLGQSLDSVFKEMNISTDYLVTSLSNDQKKFNEVTKYLFELLEQRSLYKASEYLAIKALTQNSCTLNSDFSNQLESYRVMKIGNTAPDIVFRGDVFKNGTAITTPDRLSGIKASYTIVIFGAGWCPMCTEELPRIQQFYEKWRSIGVEVVFVSLDTDAALFKSFTKNFQFISTCDYKKWETRAVIDYHVFATPTIFLLDNKRKIILRPNSVSQIDSWINYYIKPDTSELE